MSPVDDGSGVDDADVVVLASDLLEVHVLRLGAAIHRVEMPDADGHRGPIHLALPNREDYVDRAINPHLGASIGRYANRIAGASFVLDGTRHELVANDGPNTLHGGPDGWDRKVWDVVASATTPTGGYVELGLPSPAGDAGFPGRVEARARYEVDGDLLAITYSASSDAATVVNMTNHGYWNLDGAATVAAHHLSIRADEVLPVGADGIPTAGVQPVASTPFDLRSRTRIGAAIEALGAGFDHCFAVRGPAGTLRLAALLDAPASGRWMAVSTDQRGVQLYTGNGLHPPFTPHGSVSLETQAFPDSPNRPELGSVRLDPGDTYRNRTELRFGVGDPPRL